MAKEQPTLILYAVKNMGRNRKSIWQPIGAAWPHQDGKGFNISLYLLPMQGQDLVLREPMPESQDVPQNERAADDQPVDENLPI